MKTTLIVENLKCGGCAHTVKSNLMEIPGISEAEVLPEEGKVIINHTENLDLSLVKSRLYQLGYPEKGTVHGFEKLAENAKSYVSCAIGKIQSK